MNNNKEEHSKKTLQETVARNIGTGILKLQNQWTCGMNRVFNCLPAKIKIATLLLAGILLTIWNITRLSNSGPIRQAILPVQTKATSFPQILASDSLLLMERIYESSKKPHR